MCVCVCVCVCVCEKDLALDNSQEWKHQNSLLEIIVNLLQIIDKPMIWILPFFLNISIIIIVHRC